MYEMACGSARALLDGCEHDEDNAREVLQKVAALEGDLVDETKLRFPVLRVVLRAALQCKPPRIALSSVMSRGFWTGEVLSHAFQYRGMFVFQ
jgi:hypothetical protein